MVIGLFSKWIRNRMGVNLDKKLVQQFRDRWQAVAAVEAEEQLNASIELRWQQLNSILRMAI